jgi:hypothetical protein
MKKFFCTGKHSDGSGIVASIHNLSAFINASPDEFIVVTCDDGKNVKYHQVKKGDVEWGDIQRIDPVL